MKFEGEILPFDIKLFEVIVKIDGVGSVTVPLAKVSAEELSRLCDIIRQDVFKEAGKDDPRLNQRIKE